MAKIETQSEYDLTGVSLKSSEKEQLDAFFEGYFEFYERDNTRKDILDRFRPHILTACKIAKDEFNAQFNGESPDSGFGMSLTKPGYFGWDTWDNMGSSLSSGANDLIDAGTSDNLSGSTGSDNPMTIGDPAFHLILGYGSYAQSPKLTSFYKEIRKEPGTNVDVEGHFRNSEVRLRTLNFPYLLAPGDKFYLEGWTEAGGDDIPYLFGISFLKYDKLQIMDPANMSGTAKDNIAVQ